MTANEVAALLLAPVGFLLLGSVVYWITTRPARSQHPPAE